jgi:hypothetical protein
MADYDAEALGMLKRCVEDELYQAGFSGIDVRCVMTPGGGDVRVLIGGRGHALHIDRLRAGGMAELARGIVKDWSDHREF